MPHIFCCPHPSHLQWRQETLKLITGSTSKWTTRPGLDRVLQAGIAAGFTASPLNHSNFPVHYTQLITAQNNIGWDSFLYGFASTNWIPLQNEYLQTTHQATASNTGSNWLSRVYNHLWNATYALWEQHNAESHEIDQRSSNMARLIEVRRTIRVLHSKKDLTLAIDRLLLFISNLDHYLKTTSAIHMQSWVNTYKPAILDSIAATQAESVRGSQPLDTYFHPIPSQISNRPPRPRFNPHLHLRKNSNLWTRRRRTPLPAYGSIASIFTSICHPSANLPSPDPPD